MTTAIAPSSASSAGGSTPATPHVAVKTLELVEIELGSLQPHPLNRKHSDKHRLEELADSLKRQGVLTALLARPLGTGSGYQVLAGHRRLAAAKLAGLATVPVRVAYLSDAQALEVLVIENLQREDLHPLEEAQGYVALMKIDGYGIARIAERVGRSVKYVYDRMKLLQLTKEAQKLFLENRFTAGHAILLARLSPKDQKRALEGEDRGYMKEPGGLFTDEHTLFDPTEKGDEEDQKKPVSVREFQAWIDEHVRFDLAAVDPQLFPETVEALKAAADDEKGKVLHITYDHQAAADAKDPTVRTYGHYSWKRADGREGSKECAFARTAVVVAGPRRSQAFWVCVEKKKCAVHWPAEVKEAAQAAKTAKTATSSTTGSGESQKANEKSAAAKREAETKAIQAEQARWEKAEPAILKAVAAKLKTAPAGATGAAGTVLVEFCDENLYQNTKSLLAPGRTAEELVRFLAERILACRIADDHSDGWAQTLKPLGIDPKKIVDELFPKPAPEKAKPQTSAKAKGKKLAGDVRRAKKAKK